MAIRTENHENTSLFCNRLWKLMEQNGYDTPRKLATVLFDKNLVSVTQDKEKNKYNSPEEKRKNAIGSIEKKIVKHLRATEMTKIQGEFILAYREHFQCSTDYLFGFTDIQTCNPETRRICELTGLSEPSVNQLMSCAQELEGSSYIHKCWSAILESDLFTSLPFDWATAYQEACEWLKCKAAVEAINEELKGEDYDSFEYSYVAIKEKTIRKAEDGHYAAYYGMLYKLAQNITTKLDALVEAETTANNIYDIEKENMRHQVQVELSVCKGQDPPSHKADDEDFHWNSHIII